MAVNLAPHTTSDEVNAIRADYTVNGQFDASALAEDIKSGKIKNNRDLDDAIVAYYEVTGTLPYFLVAPESFFPDPSNPAVSHLWQQNEIDTYQYWKMSGNGELAKTGDRLLQFIGGLANPQKQDLFARVEQFLKEQATQKANGDVEEADGEGHLDDGWDLFNELDAQEFVHMAMQLADPGLALLFMTLWVTMPRVAEVNEAIQEQLDAGAEALEAELDNLESVDQESPLAASETQRIQQQINVISQVQQALLKMRETLEQLIDRGIAAASNISENRGRTAERVIGNIA